MHAHGGQCLCLLYVGDPEFPPRPLPPSGERTGINQSTALPPLVWTRLSAQPHFTDVETETRGDPFSTESSRLQPRGPGTRSVVLLSPQRARESTDPGSAPRSPPRGSVTQRCSAGTQLPGDACLPHWSPRVPVPAPLLTPAPRSRAPRKAAGTAPVSEGAPAPSWEPWMELPAPGSPVPPGAAPGLWGVNLQVWDLWPTRTPGGLELGGSGLGLGGAEGTLPSAPGCQPRFSSCAVPPPPGRPYHSLGAGRFQGAFTGGSAVPSPPPTPEAASEGGRHAQRPLPPPPPRGLPRSNRTPAGADSEPLPQMS